MREQHFPQEVVQLMSGYQKLARARKNTISDKGSNSGEEDQIQAFASDDDEDES